ncbi:MAG: macro domain-containing protein [Polyangiales bacterium]
MSEVKAERVLPTGQKAARGAGRHHPRGGRRHRQRGPTGGSPAGRRGRGDLRRAGLDLLECDAWVERHELRNGEVLAVSRGYALPAKRMIHAVRATSGTAARRSASPRKLRAAVSNSLDAAEKRLDAKSLSIPAISSGIFGFPKALRRGDGRRGPEWFAAHPGARFRSLRFTNIDDPTVSVFYDEVERRLG